MLPRETGLTGVFKATIFDDRQIRTTTKSGGPVNDDLQSHLPRLFGRMHPGQTIITLLESLSGLTEGYYSPTRQQNRWPAQ